MLAIRHAAAGTFLGCLNSLDVFRARGFPAVPALVQCSERIATLHIPQHGAGYPEMRCVVARYRLAGHDMSDVVSLYRADCKCDG